MSADADSLGEAADGEGSSACLSVDEPELGQTSRRSSKSMSADTDSAEEAVDGQGSSEVPATGDSISDSSSESEELGSSSRGPEVPEKGDSSSSSDSHSSSDSEELESLTENLRPRPVYPDIVPLEALPTTDVSACSLTPRSARSVGWRPDVPPVNRRDVLEPQSATSTDSADSLVVGEGAATSCVPWDDEDRPSSSCNSSWSLPSSSGEEDPTSSTGHAADASSRSDDSTPPCQVGFGQRMAPENCLRNESSSESSLSVSDSHGGPSDKAEDCRDQAASDDEWLGARAAPCLRTGASIFEWRPRVGAYRCATATDKAEEPVSVAKSAVSLVASPPAAHSSRSLATPPVSEGTKAPAACSSRSLATPPVAEGTKISVDELSVLPRYYGPHRTFLPHAQNARRHSLSRLLTSLPELDVTAVDVQGEVNVNLRMELADMKRGISIYHNRLVLLSRHRETIARPAPSYATMCEKLPQLGAHVSSLSPHKQRRSLLRACMAMVQAATTRILDMEGYLQSTSSYLRTVEDQISQNLKSRKKCSGGLRQSLERVQQLRQVHATPTTHRLLTPHWVARRLATVQHPTFQPLKIQLAALAPRVQALGVECRQRYNEVHVRAKQRQEATRWRRLSAMNRRNNRCARREREREETLKLCALRAERVVAPPSGLLDSLWGMLTGRQPLPPEEPLELPPITEDSSDDESDSFESIMAALEQGLALVSPLNEALCELRSTLDSTAQPRTEDRAVRLLPALQAQIDVQSVADVAASNGAVMPVEWAEVCSRSARESFTPKKVDSTRRCIFTDESTCFKQTPQYQHRTSRFYTCRLPNSTGPRISDQQARLADLQLQLSEKRASERRAHEVEAPEKPAPEVPAPLSAYKSCKSSFQRRSLEVQPSTTSEIQPPPPKVEPSPPKVEPSTPIKVEPPTSIKVELPTLSKVKASELNEAQLSVSGLAHPPTKPTPLDIGAAFQTAHSGMTQSGWPHQPSSTTQGGWHHQPSSTTQGGWPHQPPATSSWPGRTVASQGFQVAPSVQSEGFGARMASTTVSGPTTGLKSFMNFSAQQPQGFGQPLSFGSVSTSSGFGQPFGQPSAFGQPQSSGFSQGFNWNTGNPKPQEGGSFGASSGLVYQGAFGAGTSGLGQTVRRIDPMN